ncbi:hypothetical protein FB451DRAFT_1502593 [Mycena latifolia]|nr:hypothetical protein FB451DRAFT_1502593 [Mycena latifolia]
MGIRGPASPLRATPQIAARLVFVQYHSASWERWGALGFILKYALLGSVISIPILQIIWRIATGFSAVYIADSTIQIAVSALLIAKLMLNLYLSTVAPWWPRVSELVIFSSSSSQRRLWAVFSRPWNTYSLITSLLIFTFVQCPTVHLGDCAGAPEKKFLFSPASQRRWRIALPGVAPRSWKLHVEQTSPRVEVADEKRASSPFGEHRRAAEFGPINADTGGGTPSTARPFTGVSFASYYGMATSSRLTMPSVTPATDSRNTDSPIYGLNGIITAVALLRLNPRFFPGAPHRRPLPRIPLPLREIPSTRSTSSSFDDSWVVQRTTNGRARTGPAPAALELGDTVYNVSAPATASSGLLPSSSQQPTNYEYPVLKPLLLGSAAECPLVVCRFAADARAKCIQWATETGGARGANAAHYQRSPATGG